MRLLDPGDSINRGLVWFPTMNEAGGLFVPDISPYRLLTTRGSTTSIIQAPYGPAVSMATAGVYTGRATIASGVTPLAVAWRAKWSASHYGNFFSSGTSTSASPRIMYYIYGDGNLYCDYENVSSGRISTSISSYAGKWVNFCVINNGANRKEIWINGTLVNSATSGVALSTSYVGLRFGAGPNTFDTFQGSMQAGRVWFRALTRGEAARVTTDPWAGTVRTRRRAFWALSDVAVSLTGSAATSQAGSLSTAIAMAASGLAATAAAGTLTSALGSTVAGSAGTAAAGTLTPGIGVALTGADLTMSAGLLAYTIGFTLTGSAASSAAGTLAADDGTVLRSLTGIKMTALPGNVRVTGGTRWTPQAAQAATIPSLVGNTLPPPPRLIGDPQADNRAIQQWLTTLYDRLVKEGNILGRVPDHERRIAALESPDDTTT